MNEGMKDLVASLPQYRDYGQLEGDLEDIIDDNSKIIKTPVISSSW
jgi:hypothetical protein